MADRTPQDYAIEHAGYLADAVEQYMKVRCIYDATSEECAEIPDEISESLSDHLRALREGVYEFRKRAERAKAASPSGGESA